MVVDARQVGVIQVGQDDSFFLELALRLGCGLQVFFQGAWTLQGHVPGAVDRAEAPFTEQLDDAIAVVERLSGGQRYG